MFRLKTLVALAGLMTAVAANAQPPAGAPMPPPVPAPAVPVAPPTTEVKGEQIDRYVPDPTDATKTKLTKKTDAHYTFKLKEPVELAEPVTVIGGSLLVMPTLVQDQVMPKQIEALAPADPDLAVKVRKLAVKQIAVDESVVLQDGETVTLLAGTKLYPGSLLKVNAEKFKVVAPAVVPVPVKLATGALVTNEFKLEPRLATVEVGQLTKDRDALTEKVKVLEAKVAATPTLPPLSGQKEFADLKKDVEDLKAGHGALKKKVEDMEKALAEREKDVNKRLDDALAAATGKADATKLAEVNALLTELGNLKTLKENANKVPDLEAKVKALEAKVPAATTPTAAGDTWTKKCYTGGTVDGRIQVNGNWYRFHSHAGGNEYWYIKE